MPERVVSSCRRVTGDGQPPQNGADSFGKTHEFECASDIEQGPDRQRNGGPRPFEDDKDRTGEVIDRQPGFCLDEP